MNPPSIHFDTPARPATRQASASLEHVLPTPEIHTVVLDRQLHVQTATAGARKFFAFKNDRFETPIAVRTDALKIPDFAGCLQRALDSGETSFHEVHDGSQRSLLIRIAPSLSHNEIAAVVITIVNVQPICAAEIALSERLHRLKTITDNAPLLVCYLDTDLRFQFANARYADYYNRPPEAILGMRVRDLIGEKGWSSAATHLQRALTGEQVRFQGIVDRPTGTYFFLAEAVPDFDAAGNVIGIFTSILDTTELKRVEQRFRRAVDSTNDGFWEWDLQAGDTFISPRLYQLLDVDPQQTTLTLQSLFARLHPDDATTVRQIIHAAADAGAACDLDVRMPNGAAGYRWFHIRGRLAVEPDGNRYWSGSFRDITTMKESEAVILDAVRRRDRFLAVLSHELRNPLAAIQNAARVSAKREGEATQQEAMNVVARQAEQMRKLLHDLLEASRVVQDKITLRCYPVDVLSVADDVLGAVRMQARGKSLTITEDFSPGPLWIVGDATRLQQIQVNLLHNAIKFSKPNGTIVYRIKRKGDVVQIDVIDDGIGFSTSDRRRIFEFFQQADSNGIDRGGMGIGLSLAKRLTELHSGTIRAESKGRGRGATFTITLPLAEPPVQLPIPEETPTADHSTAIVSIVPDPVAEGVTPPTRDADGVSAPKTAAKSILVVDDAEDAREMLAVLLEDAGFRVLQANDGCEALRQIREHHPDLSLIDLGLPKMNGLEVARLVRADEATAGLRLIALSGYGAERDREKTKTAGFDDHLIKPLSDADYDRIINGAFWN